MAESDDYPEGARFAWEYIRMTDAELDLLCDYADAGLIEQADAVVDRAAERLFETEH